MSISENIQRCCIAEDSSEKYCDWLQLSQSVTMVVVIVNDQLRLKRSILVFLSAFVWLCRTLSAYVCLFAFVCVCLYHVCSWQSCYVFVGNYNHLCQYLLFDAWLSILLVMWHLFRYMSLLHFRLCVSFCRYMYASIYLPLCLFAR